MAKPGYLLEPLATIASSAIAEPLAGMSGLADRWLSGGKRSGAEEIERVREKYTYQPRSEGGKEGMQDLGRLLEPVAEALAPIGEAWTDNVVPALQDILGVESGAAVAAMLVGSANIIAERTNLPVKHIKIMKKHLKDHEKDVMTSESMKKMSEFMDREGFDAKQISELAAKGWAKKGWYKNSAKAIKDIFGEEDAKRFAYLLAATSPQTSVESNLRNTLNIWKNWKKAGRPTDRDELMKIMGESVEGGKGEKSVLDAWKNNAVRALDKDIPEAQDMKSRMLSGPKVNSFALNLLGELGELTNDTWMARAFGTEQSFFGGDSRAAMRDEYSGKFDVQSPGYMAANVTMREAAELLSKRAGETVDPAEIQEMVWSTVKSLWEKRKTPGENRSMQQIVAEGGLTDDLIQDTPDFQTLLHDDKEFHAILTDSGYEPQLRASQNEGRQSPPVHERTPAPGVGSQAASDRAFGALEERYRNEELPKVLPRLGESRARDAQKLPADTGRRQGILSPRSNARDIKGRPLEYSPADQELLRSLGVDPIRMIELDPTERSAQYFADTIARVKGENPYGAALAPTTAEELMNKRLFVGKEGESGFALGGDLQDDIQSVFKGQDAAYKNFANAVVPLAVGAGGRRLDAFDTVLPSMYSQAGFKQTSRVPWNDEFAPEGWDKDLFGNFNRGEPDVVLMNFDPANADLIRGPDKMDPYSFNRPRTYDQMSPKAQQKREGLLYDDYYSAEQVQLDAVQQALKRMGLLQPRR